MKISTRKGGVTVFFLLFLMAFSGVLAEPEIAPLTDPRNDVLVDGTQDYVVLPSTLTIGYELMTHVLTAPNGQTMTFQMVNSERFQVSFFLNGDPRSGDTDDWTATGDLSGAPVNGTWKWVSTGTPFYLCRPNCQLVVQNKELSFSNDWQAPQTQAQLWNYHVTDNSWTEPSTSVLVSGQADPIADPINEAPDEDPNLSRYYHDETTSPEPDPQAETGGENTTCETSSIDISGAFYRGNNQSENVTGYFTYAQGFFGPQTDLTLVPGSLQSNQTDLGANNNGTHNETIIYNNLVGVSYQFTAQNGSLGLPQDGLTFFVQPEQCNEPLPDVGSFNHDEDEFQIQVSQGQCSIDKTTISFMSDDPISGSDVLELFLVNAETGMVVMTYNETHFYSGPANQYFFNSTFIPSGDWFIVGYIDATGIGSMDLFDTMGFNVKEGPCTLPTLDDVTVLINNAFLNATLEELQDHRTNSIEVFGLSFATLGFDGFLIFLFLVIVFAFSIWHGYTLEALVAGLGLAMQFFPTPPIAFVGIVFLLLAAFFIEYFVGGLDGLRKRFRRDHEEDDSNPF